MLKSCQALILSKIKTVHDLDFVFNDLRRFGEIDSKQEKTLKPLVKTIIEHKSLKTYFSSKTISYNERDIISGNGTIIRPDRLVVLPNKEAVLIDYKTGTHTQEHIRQLENYQKIIEELDLVIIKKILVYVNDGIQVKEL